MKKYSITIRVHEEYDELGLVVDRDCDYFEPGVDGVVCAHDILEHTVNPHHHGIIDELMALGAVIAGRIENGYCNKHGRSLDLRDISSDIYSLSYNMICDGEDDDFCPESCNSRLNDSELMADIRKMVKDGLVEAIETAHDSEGTELYKYLYETFDIDNIVGWICKGYQKFKRRFGHIAGHNYVRLFNQITKVCDNFLSIQQEYDTTTLYVDFTNCRAFIRQDYEEYDY
jgi:hypothetical protein